MLENDLTFARLVVKGNVLKMFDDARHLRFFCLLCLQLRSRAALSDALTIPWQLGPVRLSRLRRIFPEKVPARESW